MTEERIRSLDLAEATFWLFDAASSMNFAVYACCSGRLELSALQAALGEIQKRHPLLSVRIHQDVEQSRLDFYSAPEAPISVRRVSLAEGAFLSQCYEHIAASMLQPFEAGEHPLVRCEFLESSDQFAVVLVFHHSIADGRSGLKLLESLFSILAGKEEGAKASPEFPPPLHPAFEEKMGPMSGADGALKSPVALPFFGKRGGAPRAFLSSIEVPPSELHHLRAHAREKGATLQGALGAAILGALARLGNVSGLLSLASPVDLRGKIDQPADVLALYISLITSVVNVDPEDPWKAAPEITHDLHGQMAQALQFYAMLPPPQRYLAKPDPAKPYGAFLQRLPVAAALSNAGPVAPFPDGTDWQVDRVEFSVHPSLSQVLFASVTTYKDRLHMTIHIDANRWPEDGPQTFLQYLNENLRRMSEGA
ncbi:MAG: hypothetical protein KDK37_07995 [Leptospiraceae bacterium]|nr:hypothetical protein [Leptospiraceae bacterium]